MIVSNIVSKLAVSAALITAFSGPAMAADPANHNTTRSNKTKPIAAPTDDAAQVGGHVTVLKGQETGGSDQAKAQTGYLKLGDIKGESQRSAPTGCVMFSGGLDNDCDGVEDGADIAAPNGGASVGGATKATDYNSSRSNKNSNH